MQKFQRAYWLRARQFIPNSAEKLKFFECKILKLGAER